MPNVIKIRDLSMDGKSKTEICKETGYDFKTVTKYLEKEDLSAVIPSVKHRGSKLDPYKDEMEYILYGNSKNAWHKQQLTATRLYSLILEKHPEFNASYSAVQRFVKRYKQNLQIETGKSFSRLIWHPGEAQADFGEADFITVDGTKKRYKYFVLSFPYSNIAFTQVFSGENVECVCQALINIFEHIGGIPITILFDNATGIGRRVCNVLHENEIFIRFRSHYHFQAKFANPYSGYEKGNVEANVGYIRRNIFTPEITLPKDIEFFNKTEMFTICQNLMDKRMHYVKKCPVTQLFKEDTNMLSDLPSKAFNAVRIFQKKVNGYNEILLETKHFYTLKSVYRHKTITVVTSAWKVKVYELSGELIETFDREYGNQRTESAHLRTSINNVLKKPNSWTNSKLRSVIGIENSFVKYIDTLEDTHKVSGIFKDIKKTMEHFDFDTTLNASQKLIDMKRNITLPNLLMFCSRLQTASLYFSDNSTGVDLNQYNALMNLQNEIHSSNNTTGIRAVV